MKNSISIVHSALLDALIKRVGKNGQVVLTDTDIIGLEQKHNADAQRALAAILQHSVHFPNDERFPAFIMPVDDLKRGLSFSADAEKVFSVDHDGELCISGIRVGSATGYDYNGSNYEALTREERKYRAFDWTTVWHAPNDAGDTPAMKYAATLLKDNLRYDRVRLAGTMQAPNSSGSVNMISTDGHAALVHTMAGCVPYQDFECNITKEDFDIIIQLNGKKGSWNLSMGTDANGCEVYRLTFANCDAKGTGVLYLFGTPVFHYPNMTSLIKRATIERENEQSAVVQVKPLVQTVQRLLKTFPKVISKGEFKSLHCNIGNGEFNVTLQTLQKDREHDHPGSVGFGINPSFLYNALRAIAAPTATLKNKDQMLTIESGPTLILVMNMR